MKTKLSPGFAKITNRELPERTEQTHYIAYAIAMAKNESEACVLSLLPDVTEDARFRVAKRDDAVAVALERVYTVKTGETDTPDPLVPLTDLGISLRAGALANVLVRFTATEATAAGVHEIASPCTGREGRLVLPAPLPSACGTSPFPGSLPLPQPWALWSRPSPRPTD